MKKWKHILLLAIFTFVFLQNSTLSEAATNKTRIHFISLKGSSDAILLESNGHFGMIDSGEDTDYPDGSNPKYPLRPGIVTNQGFEKDVIAYLKKAGVKKLDFYIGTHAHSDHIGSGDEILKAFKTEKLYLRKYSDENISNPNALWDNQYCYDNLINMAKKRNTTIIQNFERKSNCTLQLGDMTLELLNTKVRRTSSGKIVKQKDDNNNSLGVKITAFGQTAFLGGDMNNSAPEYDEAKAARQLGHVNLLKISHHGYAGSNSTGYLNKLSPEYAVVTGPASTLSTTTLKTLSNMETSLYSTYNQPSKSAVIADFTENGIQMISPGKLTVKTKKSNGRKKTAFYTASNKRFSSKTGWFFYDQHYYYLTAGGYIKNNSWIKEGNIWYYLNKDGQMATDAMRVKGKPYAFAATGRLSSGGWTSGKYYRSYARPNGTAYTGLKKIGKHTYFFNEDGRMQTGLIRYKKQYYYFKKNGAMLREGSVKVDGFKYTFNKKGICLEQQPLSAPAEPEPSAPETEMP